MVSLCQSFFISLSGCRLAQKKSKDLFKRALCLEVNESAPLFFAPNSAPLATLKSANFAIFFSIKMVYFLYCF